MLAARTISSVVAIKARALSIGEENVRLPIVVVVNRAYATAAVFDDAELELRSVLFDIELWVALMFVVNANCRQFLLGLERLKVTTITTYTDSFDQLILHDLPVVRAGAAFVDEMPAIKIAVLKNC